MINNQYQLYIDNVLNLAETIVIKLSQAAEAMNSQVMIENGLNSVDASDQSSWKYYQNISGRYHFSDSAILVASLDTTEIIAFTKENLITHSATKEAYQFGSRYYRELILQYPDKELLILGVLYPVNIDVAIAAKDGVILGYPSYLVENNEYNFVSKLQKWVDKYLFRWVNKQFALSDDLYVATYIGQLYLHMVPAIINIRLDACKTNEAHSFHVQQYLASHGFLDTYLSTMTKYQALFFYRNILYIQRNAGRKDTFDWLVQNIMTHRRLPFFEYAMNHDISGMFRTEADLLESALQGETAEHKEARLKARRLPDVIFKRKAVNNLAKNVQTVQYSLGDILAKTAPLAIGNPEFQVDKENIIRDEFAYSPSSVVTTKMLESSVVDYTDAVVYTFTDILFNQWLSFVTKNKYTATIILDLPKTGTNVRLEAQEAVALFIYAIMKSYEPDVIPVGYPLITRIPKVRSYRVLRDTPTTFDELRSITKTQNLSSAEINEILATAVVQENLLSINSFYTKAQEIFASAQKQYTLYSSKEHLFARAQAKQAVSRLYNDEERRLTALSSNSPSYLGNTYSSFLTAKGLDLSSYTITDFHNLALSIVKTATGISKIKNITLADIQRSMVKLFTQLSSYSIQVVTEINDSKITVVPFPQIRVGDYITATQFYGYIETAYVAPMHLTAMESKNIVLNVNDVFPSGISSFSESFKAKFNIGIDFSEVKALTGSEPDKIYTGINVSSSYDFDRELAELTSVQRDLLVDIYCEDRQSFTNATIFVIKGFSYSDRRKGLDIFKLGTGLDAELPIFKQLPVPFAIDGFTYIGKRKQVSVSVTPEDINETLDGFTYSGSYSDTLNAFVYDFTNDQFIIP